MADEMNSIPKLNLAGYPSPLPAHGNQSTRVYVANKTPIGITLIKIAVIIPTSIVSIDTSIHYSITITEEIISIYNM